MKKDNKPSAEAVEANDDEANSSTSEAVVVTEQKQAAADKAVNNSEADEQLEDDRKIEPQQPSEEKPPIKPRRSWFSLFNFILILGICAAAWYYWDMQQKASVEYRATIDQLQQKLSSKAERSSVDSLASSMRPLRAKVGSIDKQVAALDQQQQALQQSSEELFKLFGRDKNDWQLTEVEYLMRVAQHKLVLQHDFVGAALTLQAANDKIAETADPGLLPVRVQLSEEIAALKTRKQIDLVGIALTLSQLRRQLPILTPGFVLKAETPAEVVSLADNKDLPWLDRLQQFFNSLFDIRKEAVKPGRTDSSVYDATETLMGNFTLARWAVIERNESQFRRLVDSSIDVFRKYYSLDDNLNQAFFSEMQELQKMVIKPELPDINGSLQLLRFILEKRDNAPNADLQPKASEEAVAQ